jgi:hypothetical protein
MQLQAAAVKVAVVLNVYVRIRCVAATTRNHLVQYWCGEPLVFAVALVWDGVYDSLDNITAALDLVDSRVDVRDVFAVATPSDDTTPHHVRACVFVE